MLQAVIRDHTGDVELTELTLDGLLDAKYQAQELIESISELIDKIQEEED